MFTDDLVLVWKCRQYRMQTLIWDSATWITLFGVYTAFTLCYHARSPWFPAFILIQGAPSERRVTCWMCPPVFLCLLSNRERTLACWQLAPLRSTVICCTVSRSHCGSQCGHWQAILDWNSYIPLSNQTSTTLKVNKNPERKIDNIRAADPPYLWEDCVSLICPITALNMT